MNVVIQYILYLAILVVLAIPLGAYIKNVMNGEKTFLSKLLTPCENAVYKVLRVDKDEQMNWKNTPFLFSSFLVSDWCFVFAPTLSGFSTRKSTRVTWCKMGFVF